MAVIDTDEPARAPRYEFRVWGDQALACERLSALADGERYERLDDCYLFVGDRSCNAKIRRNRLKVKRLLEVRDGFQRWTSSWEGAGTRAPRPFDEVLAVLSPGEPGSSGGAKPRLRRLVTGLERRLGLRAVFVVKHRRRFDVGPFKAEATEVELPAGAGRLSTVAIEGEDLEGLVDLRASLGLAHLPNVALHLAVETAHLERVDVASRVLA